MQRKYVNHTPPINIHAVTTKIHNRQIFIGEHFYPVDDWGIGKCMYNVTCLFYNLQS